MWTVVSMLGPCKKEEEDKFNGKEKERAFLIPFPLLAL